MNDKTSRSNSIEELELEPLRNHHKTGRLNSRGQAREQDFVLFVVLLYCHIFSAWAALNIIIYPSYNNQWIVTNYGIIGLCDI